MRIVGVLVFECHARSCHERVNRDQVTSLNDLFCDTHRLALTGIGPCSECGHESYGLAILRQVIERQLTVDLNPTHLCRRLGVIRQAALENRTEKYARILGLQGRMGRP